MRLKIRCSQIGKIMAQPKNEEPLSVGAMTYCNQWLKEQLYSRRKEFSNKYTQKGNICEIDSLDLIGGYEKNEQNYSNEWLTGTPDVVTKDKTIDVKSSWSWETFPLFDTELPNKDYYWQGMGYMALTGVNLHEVAYCLTDTPYYLIVSETKRYCYDNGYSTDVASDEFLEIFRQKESSLVYKDIPINLKVKKFIINREEDKIEQIYKKVEECRIYISNQLKQL